MKLFRIWFIVFSYIIVGIQTFIAGTEANKHWYANVVLNLVVALLWAGVGTLFAHMAYKDGKLDANMENLKRTGELFKELAGIEERRMKDVMNAKPIDHNEQITNTLMQVVDGVTGGNRPPKQSELATIAAKFHEATGDHFVKITLQAGGMEVEISDKPFATAKKRAPRAKKLEQTELVPEKKK